MKFKQNVRKAAEEGEGSGCRERACGEREREPRSSVAGGRGVVRRLHGKVGLSEGLQRKGAVPASWRHPVVQFWVRQDSKGVLDLRGCLSPAQRLSACRVHCSLGGGRSGGGWAVQGQPFLHSSLTWPSSSPAGERSSFQGPPRLEVVQQRPEEVQLRHQALGAGGVPQGDPGAQHVGDGDGSGAGR